jgi:hypothetical protein
MIDDLPHAKLVKFFVTLWAIWSARRKLIHQGIMQSSHATHSFVERYIAELETIKAPSVQSSSSGVTGGSVQRRDEIVPAPGEVKILVDGGLSRNGWRGAAAAVCRDH